MRRQLIQGLVFGVVILCSVRPAAAQTGMVGGGVSFMTDSATGPGFALNVSQEVRTMGQIGWAPVGDFSWHTNDGDQWSVFGGGIRANIHPMNARVTPFGQFLIGASYLKCDGCNEGETELSLIFGGGIHVPVSGRWSALFEFNAVNVRFDGGSTTGKRTTLGLSTSF